VGRGGGLDRQSTVLRSERAYNNKEGQDLVEKKKSKEISGSLSFVSTEGD